MNPYLKTALGSLLCLVVCSTTAERSARAMDAPGLLSLADAGFEAGRFDVFRLLGAARDSLRVRASRIDAIEAAWSARIELERAVGGEVKS